MSDSSQNEYESALTVYIREFKPGEVLRLYPHVPNISVYDPVFGLFDTDGELLMLGNSRMCAFSYALTKEYTLVCVH